MSRGGVAHRGNLVRDDAGASSVLGFLVASAFFTLVFVGVIEFTTQADTSIERAQRVDLETESHRLALELFNSAGQGWYGVPCAREAAGRGFAPQGVTRFGLAADACEGSASSGFNLSFEKLTHLRKAGLARNDSNGALDYAEAHDSLALTDLQFHLRTRVATQEAQTLLERGLVDRTLRPLYLGDYDEIRAGHRSPEVSKRCGQTPTADGVVVWVEVTNDGLTAAAFNLKFTLSLRLANIDVYKFTPLLAPNATARVQLFLPKSSDWAWGNPQDPSVNLRIKDMRGTSLGTCRIGLQHRDLLGAQARFFLNVPDHWQREHLHLGRIGKKVVVEAYTGSGVRYWNAAYRLQALDSQGRPAPAEGRWHENGWKILPPVLDHRFNLTLLDGRRQVVGTDALHLPLGAQGLYTPRPPRDSYVPRDSVRPEAAYLDALVASFDPHVHDARYDHPTLPYRAAGDVLPDLKRVLNDDLPRLLVDDRGTPSPHDDVGTLSRYNVLVVGSNVDHTAMTSDAAKDAVRKWVEAGGLLIVLGSNQQSVQWLRPLFHVGIARESAPLRILQPAHHLLSDPNTLPVGQLDDTRRVWRFTGPGADKFDLLTARGNGATVAVSKDGAYGSGRIVLTTWRPFSPHGQGALGPCNPTALAAECEGLRMLQNFLASRLDNLQVDYGPPLPSASPLGSVTRLVSVYHPSLQQSVELQATIYVFR